jgi:hypothetical protein
MEQGQPELVLAKVRETLERYLQEHLSVIRGLEASASQIFERL